MIIIKKYFLLFLLLFFTFIFNISNIDSNSDKLLIYDMNDIHYEGNFNISFVDLNSYDFKKYISFLKLNINSIDIGNIRYDTDDIDIAISMYLKNKSDDEKLYYELNGVNINAVNVTCEINEIIKLESFTNIY